MIYATNVMICAKTTILLRKKLYIYTYLGSETLYPLNLPLLSGPTG